MKTRLLATVAILAAAIIAIGVFGAAVVSAQAPPRGARAQVAPSAGQPVRLEGKITSVGTSSLVLTTRNGDVTANISGNTFIAVQKNNLPAQGTITDIVTGKAAIVVGVATSDPKVVDAKMIAQGAMAGRNGPGQHPKARQLAEHMAAGTITAINGNVITLQGVKVPEVIVNTNAATVVLNNGFTTVSSLKVGDKVAVLGAPQKPATTAPGTPGTSTQTQSRTINAWGLRVDNGTTQLAAAHVESINGNTLTVKTLKNRGGLTIQLDANTAYKTVTISQTDRTASLSDASQADVTTGSNLLVEGVTSTDGKTITAKAVIIMPAGRVR